MMSRSKPMFKFTSKKIIHLPHKHLIAVPLLAQVQFFFLSNIVQKCKQVKILYSFSHKRAFKKNTFKQTVLKIEESVIPDYP